MRPCRQCHALSCAMWLLMLLLPAVGSHPSCCCPALAPPRAPPQARRLIRPLRLAPSPPLRRGDPVELVCLSKSLRILHRTSNVTNGVMSVSIRKAEVPRFRWGGRAGLGRAGLGREKGTPGLLLLHARAVFARAVLTIDSIPTPGSIRHYTSHFAPFVCPSWLVCACRAVHEEVIKLDQDFGLAYSGQQECSNMAAAVKSTHSAQCPHPYCIFS